MSRDGKDETTGSRASSGGSGGSDIRSARRAQREAERAARAQRKADAARERALEAARAGGLFEGMGAMPQTEAASTGTPSTGTPSTDTPSVETAATTSNQSGDAERSPSTAVDSRATARGPAKGDGDTPEAQERRRRLIPVLAAVSVILLVLAGLATWGYVGAREDTAVEQAIADAPQEATDAARDITTQMFSYDHQTVDAELAAVREHLADPALTEFVERSMPTVSSAAKQQEATVFATVAAAASEEVVDEDHVTVLVMLNRMVSTKEEPKAASSASRLRVDMVRDGGEWKLGKLTSL